MKKFKNGLYVGKFLSYHKGHQFYINYFSNLCEKLKLVLCVREKDRVPYMIRKKWFEEDIIYNKFGEISNHENIEIFMLNEDNNVDYPEGLKNWCPQFKKLVGEVDIMFGNEEYVINCAKEMGIDYYVPDLSRKKLDISSTKILDNKLKYYDLITTVAKPYFNRKVLIIGPESTGKTTLTKMLTEHFNGVYIQEYGREYYENQVLRTGIHGFNHWTVKEFENIAEHQNNLIIEQLEKPSKILFVDTDALSTEIYSNLYIRQTSTKLQSIIKQQIFDLIIFLDSNNTLYKEDGTRILKNERDFVSNYIKYSLNFFKKPFVVIENSKGYDKRFETIKALISENFNI